MEFPADVFQNGLSQINLSGKVAKGCNCTIKAILKGKAKIVFLADDCDKSDYKAVITGLAKKHNVPLVNIPQKEQLAKALALVNLRADGTARRTLNCGSCALVKYGLDNDNVLAFKAAFDPLYEPTQAQE